METELVKLFRDQGHDDGSLVEGIARLASRKGDRIFSQALKVLAGLEFSPTEAKLHWQAILVHSQKLCPNQAPSRFRAAMIDYFHREIALLHDPRVLEASDLEEMRKASVTDGLTGLYHQGYFKARLEELFNWKKRSSQERFAVVLLDLDHFKQYNDRCGHLGGDEALRRVAEAIRLNIRDYDVAARYGGEEFALLLFRVTPRQAFTVTERIRETIAGIRFREQEKLDSGNLTISGGIAMYPADAQSPRDLLEKADKRLYQAKRTRNLVVPSDKDRRRGVRRKIRSIVELVQKESNHSCPGMTLDLSTRGLAIDCAVAFRPGSTLQVHFREPFWNQEAATNAVVRRICRDEESGIVHLGLEFEKACGTFSSLVGKTFNDNQLGTAKPFGA